MFNDLKEIEIGIKKSINAQPTIYNKLSKIEEQIDRQGDIFDDFRFIKE